MHRRVLLANAAALVLGAALASAQPPPPTQPGIPEPKVITDAPDIGRYGGALAVSRLSDPQTFNPIVAQDASSRSVLAPVFDRLLEQNYLTGALEPGLAAAWTVSPDGRTWTFTLRDGVSWSDGTPLTADDVIFSLDAVFTEGVQTALADLLTVDGRPIRYRKIDARRIQVATETPAGLVPRLIAALDIIPKHALADALAVRGAAFNRTWGVNTSPKELVGTGPFVMQSYVPGERVTYLRNGRYWQVDRKGNRLPYLTRYVVAIVPNQEAERLKFLAAETDVYTVRPREYADLKRGEQAGNYTLYDGPESLSAEFLVLNQNPAGLAPPKLTWFQDVAFRRALNYAIDRATIADQIYAGRATPAWGPLSPANTLYLNPHLPQYPYDVSRAQQVLAEAGYRKGTDGVLRDAQGNPVDFTLSTNAGNADREAIGQILRQDFTRLGMRVTFAPEPFTTLAGKLVGTFTWDAVIIGLTSVIEPGAGERNVWLSSGSLHMWRPGQQTPATPWEAEIDRVFDQISREPDTGKRAQLYHRWQEIVAQQVPMMFLVYPKTQLAVRNTVGNIRPGLGGAIGGLSTLYYKTTYR